ncbi:MAG: iron chelate uptake ABC transporter family permease subunit [Pseudomonadales bacterium]|nr:iron chelate uptake ABC transporter family permease subunit [Pseudomonadales bacterium]
MRVQPRIVFITLIFILLLFSLWHIGAGAIYIAPLDVFIALQSSDSEHNFIVNNFRLPRLLISGLVGAALAISGLLIQGVIRNPLASPDVLGVTSGASLAVITLAVFWPDAPTSYIPPAALIGGFSATALLLFLARHLLHRPAAFALVGIALATTFGAAIDYLLTVNPLEINTAMLWLTGSVWGRNWDHLPLIAPWLAVLMPLALLLAYRLDLLGLGDDTATSLGIGVKKLRLLCIVVAISLASAAVSVCGSIGFVGLVSPHLARSLLGHRHLLLIPATAITGAILVISADLFARILMPPIELPAGILTAFIGAPYFIFLLCRYKNW